MRRGRGAQPSGLPIILGVNTWGGYAEYVKVPVHVATHVIPAALDFMAAAVVARHAPLAFTQLRDRAKVKPGDWVLIMGAAGGLGSIALQAAKHLGAQVIAAAGTDARVDAARQLGADAGVNYRGQDLTAEVRPDRRRRRGRCRAGEHRRSRAFPKGVRCACTRRTACQPPAATRAGLCRLTSSIFI